LSDRELGLLDQFGQLLIHRVRDETLAEIDDVVTGRAHPEWKRELHATIERSMDPEQRELLRHVVAIAIDAAIHNVLRMIESNDALRLESIGPGQERHDLVDMSDGLSGELWTEDGWIARFSRDRDPGSSLLY
jgi:hypothetical protein